MNRATVKLQPYRERVSESTTTRNTDWTACLMADFLLVTGLDLTHTVIRLPQGKHWVRIMPQSRWMNKQVDKVYLKKKRKKIKLFGCVS